MQWYQMKWTHEISSSLMLKYVVFLEVFVFINGLFFWLERARDWIANQTHDESAQDNWNIKR